MSANASSNFRQQTESYSRGACLRQGDFDSSLFLGWRYSVLRERNSSPSRCLEPTAPIRAYPLRIRSRDIQGPFPDLHDTTDHKSSNH